MLHWHDLKPSQKARRAGSDAARNSEDPGPGSQGSPSRLAADKRSGRGEARRYSRMSRRGTLRDTEKAACRRAAGKGRRCFGGADGKGAGSRKSRADEQGRPFASAGDRERETEGGVLGGRVAESGVRRTLPLPNEELRQERQGRGRPGLCHGWAPPAVSKAPARLAGACAGHVSAQPSKQARFGRGFLPLTARPAEKDWRDRAGWLVGLNPPGPRGWQSMPESSERGERASEYSHGSIALCISHVVWLPVPPQTGGGTCRLLPAHCKPTLYLRA